MLDPCTNTEKYNTISQVSVDSTSHCLTTFERTTNKYESLIDVHNRFGYSFQ